MKKPRLAHIKHFVHFCTILKLHPLLEKLKFQIRMYVLVAFEYVRRLQLQLIEARSMSIREGCAR